MTRVAIVPGGDSGIGLAVEVDVTDRPRIEAGVAEVKERLGRPTILVNNAGLDWFQPYLSAATRPATSPVRCWG